MQRKIIIFYDSTAFYDFFMIFEIFGFFFIKFYDFMISGSHDDVIKANDVIIIACLI